MSFKNIQPGDRVFFVASSVRLWGRAERLLVFSDHVVVSLGGANRRVTVNANNYQSHVPAAEVWRRTGAFT